MKKPIPIHEESLRELRSINKRLDELYAQRMGAQPDRQIEELELRAAKLIEGRAKHVLDGLRKAIEEAKRVAGEYLH